jgi:hypothetical protein
MLTYADARRGSCAPRTGGTADGPLYERQDDLAEYEAAVCRRMLTYAGVCWCMLTGATADGPLYERQDDLAEYEAAVC